MIYILDQILLGLTNQEGWEGQRMWHEWGFWYKTLKKRDQSILLKWILQK